MSTLRSQTVTIRIYQDDNVAVAEAWISDDTDDWNATPNKVTGSSKRAPGDTRDQDYGRNLALVRALENLGILT